MGKEQKRKKYQHKQKQKKIKELAPEKRAAHLVGQLAESPDATSALKRALEKTIKA